MRCQKKGLTGAKGGLLAMSVIAVVVIVVAMECVWLLVCACAALEFSVLQRFVSLRVYLLASLSFVDSTIILSLQWRLPQDRRPIASLPLSWPCTWTGTTSHTPDPRGRERIAYGATCRQRTHPCPQTSQRPSSLPQTQGTRTPSSQTKGRNNQTPSNQGRAARVRCRLRQTKMSHSPQTRSTCSILPVHLALALPAEVAPTRGATVAVALPHLPRPLRMTHSPVPPPLAHSPDAVELTVTTAVTGGTVRHGLMATVNQMGSLWQTP